MNLIDKIKHWYWDKYDPNYSIVFIMSSKGSKWKLKSDNSKGSVRIYAPWFSSAPNAKQIPISLRISADMYMVDLGMSKFTYNQISVRIATLNWSNLSIKKSEFILKHFSNMFISHSDSQVIVRNRKISKIK